MKLTNDEIHSAELKMIEEICSISKINNLHYTLGYGSVLGAVRHRGFIPWDTDIDILVSYDTYDEFCDVLRNNLSEGLKVEYVKFDEDYSSLKARVVNKDKDSNIVHVDVFPVNYAPKSALLRGIISRLLYVNYRAHFVKTSKTNIAKSYPKVKKTIFYMSKGLLFIIPKKLFIYTHNKIGKLLSKNKTDIMFNMCGSYGKKEFIHINWFMESVSMKFENLELPIPKDFREYLTHFYGDYNIPKKENYV